MGGLNLFFLDLANGKFLKTLACIRAICENQFILLRGKNGFLRDKNPLATWGPGREDWRAGELFTLVISDFPRPSIV